MITYIYDNKFTLFGKRCKIKYVIDMGGGII